VGEEVGAVAVGFGEGLLAAPFADGEVVALLQNFGDFEAEEVGGAGVVRVVEEAAGEMGGVGDTVFVQSEWAC
jgi:hypothetical protein